MEYRITISWDNENGERREYYCRAECREVGIDNLARRVPADAQNISMKFDHNLNGYVQEIVEKMGLQVEEGVEKRAFSENKNFTISGNDRLILPAWYWIVLALRIADDNCVSFENMLEKAVEEDTEYRRKGGRGSFPYFGTCFYWNGAAAKDSLEKWRLFLREGTTPTTEEMLKRSVCVLEYFNGVDNSDDDDYEDDGDAGW